jgi:hypothetical protein
MSLNISQQTETLIVEEARRQGLSVDTLLENLIKRRSSSSAPEAKELPELPVLHLGQMGPLHRRDIYSDVL